MNKFFPVGSRTIGATSPSQTIAIPTGGPMIRISRETNSLRCFIKFGGASVTADVDSMELVSGIVEELENPNPAAYTYFAVYAPTGVCNVNVSTGPRYDSK